MIAVIEKADLFERLQHDETYQQLMRELKSQQVDIFLDNTAKIDDIDKAHQMVVALSTIEQYLQTVIDDGKVELARQQKANQHREHD